MAEVNGTPVCIDQNEIEVSIANYKQQSAGIVAQLQQLEQNKTHALKMLDVLSGATQALEQLVQNITDRRAEAAKAVEEAQKAADAVKPAEKFAAPDAEAAPTTTA